MTAVVAVAAAPPNVVSVQHWQAIALVGAGLGVKSVSLTPGVWDYGADAAYGSTSSQYTATGSKLPVAAGGNYNIQNQPPGFAPTGYPIGSADQFARATISGCHAFSGVNDSNSVMLGYAWSPPNNGSSVTGYPFCSVHEYFVCYDPNLAYNPQSDCNTKEGTFGDSQTCFGGGQYDYYEPFPIGLFPISGIDRTNPAVIHCPQNQAGSPVSVGDVMCLFGIAVTTQGNQLAAAVTAQGGSNGNFTYTLGSVDATGWSAYPGAYTISAATNASPCHCTINDPGSVHPLINRTFIWVQGAAGGSWAGQTSGVNNFNKRNNMCAINLGGVPGAWTFDLIDGQFSGVNIDSSSYGTYTPGSATFTVGGLSVPFNTMGATFAQNTYIDPKKRRMNPINQLQNPDAAGNGMTALAASRMYTAPTGFKRRRWEICWTQSATLTPGYCRIFDDGVLVFNFVGRTDNLSASTIWRNFGMGSVYQSSRGLNNFVHMQEAYHDWTTAGGQVARVYAGNASTYAACTNLVPQPYITAWSNTGINLSHFWQGTLLDTDTVYFYALPEAGPVGTAIVLNGGQAYTISPVPRPSIVTASIPGANHGVAYNSGPITASGGTGPYTYYLASAATGQGGQSAAQSGNSWSVNPATGAITGTPTVVGTDLVVVTAIDSFGSPLNCWKMFNLVVN